MFVKQKYKGQTVHILTMGMSVEATDDNAQILFNNGFAYMVGVEKIKTTKVDNKPKK
jgi:hypothetical protein